VNKEKLEELKKKKDDAYAAYAASYDATAYAAAACDAAYTAYNKALKEFKGEE